MSGATTIGVDLGGTKMLVGALDGTKVLYESREASTGQGEDELVELLVREVSEARDACPAAVGVGLGIPATIDYERGVAVSAVNLPLSDLPIRDRIEAEVELPVFVDNDGNVAALAEFMYGAARGMPHVVMAAWMAWPTSSPVPGWAGWPLTSTGHPAASAEAVSPPAMDSSSTLSLTRWLPSRAVTIL